MITRYVMLLYLFTLTLVQLTGFFFFVDYYIRLKKHRFSIISLGWALNIVGIISFLIWMDMSASLLRNFVYLSSALFFVLGTFFISVVMLLYFGKMEKNITCILGIILILFPVIIFVISDHSAATDFIDLERMLIYSFLILYGIKNRKRVIELSKSSYILFILSTSLSLISLIAIHFDQSDISSIIYLSLDIWISVIFIMFLIHLEHNISLREKFLLKDKFSHDLANFMQIAVNQLDLAVLTNDKKDIEKAQKTVFDANDLLLRIRKL